jgi:hypothetical protein
MSVVLFPSQPFSPREIDADFEAEQMAARAAGLTTALVDHTGIMSGAVAAAVARVPNGRSTALYRGWMLKPAQYEAFHAELLTRDVSLVNTPAQYRTCHYLPDSYPWIQGKTPRTVWVPMQREFDFASIAPVLAPFGDRPIVVKDYVKSQKHYWAEACFIPAASDLPAVQRVLQRFLELQGEDLNEGLVFREFVPLKIVGAHPKSRLPLAAEFRIFWLDGEPIVSHRYWGDLTAFDVPLPFDEIRPIAARIPSRFFTMDVAFLNDGGWTIVELGDGQVAGLPSHDLAPEFFTRIAAARAFNGPA